MGIRCSSGARLAASAASFALVLAFAGSAAAEGPPTNPQCWGVVTSQRASTEHDIGEHASSQTEPRLGIGNVADLLTGSHQPGALGSFLASLDNLDATACP